MSVLSEYSFFFSEGEYIAADSGYASSKYIVPAFKRSKTSQLSPAQNPFNNAIAKIWVALEHTDGFLKMCFGSREELRLAIRNSDEASFACDWIAACIVIHNLVIEEGSPMWG